MKIKFLETGWVRNAGSISVEPEWCTLCDGMSHRKLTMLGVDLYTYHKKGDIVSAYSDGDCWRGIGDARSGLPHSVPKRVAEQYGSDYFPSMPKAYESITIDGKRYKLVPEE